MAGDMKPGRRCFRRLFPLLLVALAGGVAAAPLADPTQPPAAHMGDGADPGRRLTSILLPKQGRPAAVIDGRVVPLGGTVGDARLTRVTEGEVVLDGPDGRERLYLTPDVSKKTTANQAAVRRNKE